MTVNQEVNVGQRIRSLREKKGLSLRKLADKSGLSVNAISRIERGENSPTVSSLHQLAGALEVRLVDFFQEEAQQVTVFVKSDQRFTSRREGMTLENLAIGLREQQVEPFLITIEPGANSAANPITHPGQEFIYCINGTLTYEINGTLYELETGDSLLFEAEQPHVFSNKTAEVVTILIVFQVEQGSHLARRPHLD